MLKLFIHNVICFYLFLEKGDDVSIHNISSVLNAVNYIKDHWYIIGIRLRVSEKQLNNIWEDSCKADVISKKVYCCCKMLSVWYKEGNNVTVQFFLNAVSLSALGLSDKIPVIRSILLDSSSDKSVHDASHLKLDEVQKRYALMIVEVIKIIDGSDTDVDILKLFLSHCKDARTSKAKISSDVYDKATSFSEIISALEINGFITHLELSWLKYLVSDVANSTKALNVIEKYEQLNIAHMLHWRSDVKQDGTFLFARTDTSPELVRGSDVSKAKSVTSKLFGIEETDVLLDSAGVGSVVIYWRLCSNQFNQSPETITKSLKQMCYEASITHVGAVVDRNITMIDIHLLKIDDRKLCKSFLCYLSCSNLTTPAIIYSHLSVYSFHLIMNN